MKKQIVMFPRKKGFITANIISTVLEPLDNGSAHQVVFFCQDRAGNIYHVLKSEVVKL